MSRLRFHDLGHAVATALRELVVVGFVTRSGSREHDVVSRLTARRTFVSFWIVLEKEKEVFCHFCIYIVVFVTILPHPDRKLPLTQNAAVARFVAETVSSAQTRQNGRDGTGRENVGLYFVTWCR